MSINHEKLGRKTSNNLEVSISRETLEEQDRAVRSIQISRLGVAKDLGKEIPIINVDAKGFKIKQNAHTLLSNVFVHIIRNSLDHGIETAAERIGKRPMGRIDIQLEQQGESLIIRYHDDGRGLDPQSLREKPSRAKLLSAGDAQDLQKLAKLIFIPGLSTAHSVTEVSGRGIGMDAG